MNCSIVRNLGLSRISKPSFSSSAFVATADGQANALATGTSRVTGWRLAQFELRGYLSGRKTPLSAIQILA